MLAEQSPPEASPDPRSARNGLAQCNVEPDVADIRVRTGEDRKVVNGEDRHIVKSHKLGVLHFHREGWDAEAIVTEPEHGISEHQAHDSRLHRAGSLDMLTRTMIWMERERERGHPLHVARKRSDETLKAMNNHHAVVEETRNNVLTKEVRERASVAGAEGGI